MPMKTEKSGYILSLDQGTTSSRAILFDHSGRIVSSSQRDFPQYYPEPGWVEHDAVYMWPSQLGVAREAIAAASIDPAESVSIGITNHPEPVVVWDKDSGK